MVSHIFFLEFSPRKFGEMIQFDDCAYFSSGVVKNHQLVSLRLGFRHATRWALTSYKWDYSPCKWPYKWGNWGSNPTYRGDNSICNWLGPTLNSFGMIELSTFSAKGSFEKSLMHQPPRMQSWKMKLGGSGIPEPKKDGNFKNYPEPQNPGRVENPMYN